MKKIICAMLAVSFIFQLCSCSNKKNDKTEKNTQSKQTIEFTDAEKKFNEISVIPDRYLAVSSDTDLADMFTTAYLINSYDFEINKASAEKLLKDTISEITKGKKTNTEKAKACYDWLIKNVEYYDYGFHNWVSLIVIFSDKQGNPFDYSYAFYSMLRYIGIDAKYVTGFRSLETGGNSMHAWVTVDIEGITYYFDPFTDQNNADLQGTETCYDCFLKTDEEVGYRYVANENPTEETN